VVKCRGALVFKGSGPIKRAPARRRPAKVIKDTDSTFPLETAVGEGRIVCSGDTVQGMETRFKEQIAVGDIVVIFHPQTLLKEERVVTAILSQRSLTIDSPFSSDFVSTIQYSVRSQQKETELQSHGPLKKEEEHESNPNNFSESRLGVHGVEHTADKILTYREKVGMSYRTVSVKVDKGMSKEDLLDLQTKKSHDRYC